ncbi:MAG: hypothetical protein VW080_09415 [Flavobacteriaceae bacterium]
MWRFVSLTFFMGLLLSFSHCAKEAESNPTLYFKLRTEILPKQGGSILLDEGDYLANSIRTVYARPNEGWIFDHWEGIISGLNNPTEIVFYGDHDIRAVFIQDTFKIRTVAGGKGKGYDANQFNYPTGIAYDKEGDLYISDMHNHRVQKWMKGATFGMTVAGGNNYGSDENQLNEPGKIALDAIGNLYIADTGNNRLQKWFKGAKKGITVAGGNGVGSGLDQLNEPYGLFLDTNGALYITEIQNQRVVRYDPGERQGVIVAGGNGQGNQPNQLSYPLGITADKAGNIYVADTYNHRVQLWKPGATEGITLLSAEDIQDENTNFFTGITLDGEQHLLLSDYQKRRIIQFDISSKTYQIIAGDNEDGNATNQFSHPYQIVSKNDQEILVADAKNNRIQKWKRN